jgi:hypothetical protein
MVTKAQAKLREQYSTERLREQVLEIFDQAMAGQRGTAGDANVEPAAASR